jgi:uncharacterized membrane protein
MDALVKSILFIHIAAGFTALLTGFIAILARKGGKAHKRSGKWYFMAMFTVAVTAVILSLVKSILFLLCVAVFSFYLSFTGYRAVYQKRAQAKTIDWAVMIVTFLVNIAMLFTGEIVLIVFAVISLANVFADYKFYTKKVFDHTMKHKWIFRHIAKMLGSYIATVTAFVVTNIHFPNPLMGWLLPTLIGSPLIAYTIYTYRKKLLIPKSKVVEAEV